MFAVLFCDALQLIRAFGCMMRVPMLWEESSCTEVLYLTAASTMTPPALVPVPTTPWEGNSIIVESLVNFKLYVQNAFLCELQFDVPIFSEYDFFPLLFKAFVSYIRLWFSIVGKRSAVFVLEYVPYQIARPLCFKESLLSV